jgi:hypothetical protein
MKTMKTKTKTAVRDWSGFTRVDSEGVWYGLDGAEPLVGFLRGCRETAPAPGRNAQMIYEFVALQNFQNGNRPDVAGGPVEAGSLVLVGETAGLRILRAFVAKPLAVAIEPTEKSTTRSGQAFWRIAVYHRPLTGAERAQLGPYLSGPSETDLSSVPF